MVISGIFLIVFYNFWIISHNFWIVLHHYASFPIMSALFLTISGPSFISHYFHFAVFLAISWSFLTIFLPFHSISGCFVIVSGSFMAYLVILWSFLTISQHFWLFSDCFWPFCCICGHFLIISDHFLIISQHLWLFLDYCWPFLWSFLTEMYDDIATQNNRTTAKNNCIKYHMVTEYRSSMHTLQYWIQNTKA